MPKASRSDDFWESYAKSFSIIFVSEIADKSFIMVLYFTIASKKIHSFIIFLVSSFALILMCILSVAVGYAIPLLLNKSLLEWIAILVFGGFGILTIYQGTTMSYEDTVNKKVHKAAEVGIDNLDSEDENEVKNKELRSNKEIDLEGRNLEEIDDLRRGLLKDEQLDTGNRVTTTTANVTNLANPNVDENDHSNSVDSKLVNKADKALLNSSFWFTIWTMFSLVVLSEWGDKTMFSTIVIASVFNVYGVFFGAITSYFLTCLIAVLAGKFFGRYLNEKIMCYVGGLIFIAFALDYLIEKIWG